jgi:Fe-S-cluster-containing hydrogenase component 2
MEDNGIQDLSEIRGSALGEIKSFDEIQVEPKISHLKEACGSPDCRKCVDACIYGALEKKGSSVTVRTDLCRGCGLCCDICNAGFIELIWP